MQELTLDDPQSENQPELQALGSQFYVVSLTKFVLLYIFTFSAYSVYWHYKNWQQYKRATNEDLWAPARAFFNIFFTHALFHTVDMQLSANDKTYNWRPGLWATVAVVTILIARIAGQFIDDSASGGMAILIFLAGLAIYGVALFNAQKAINLSCNDPDGESNSTLTGVNYFFMLLGFVWILLLVVGLALDDKA